ncbi:acyl-CoA dehydrogenase family protein [Hyalangium minutum]|uniref:Isovaleryl-CoA dehydrogenase n=1 Tax=Hyalangium minutum TaxID=394096 RepID=A0A085WP88_9BACT|nr:acyl-CoA dehydrogenase family protein [Hyalangium minutum]KFE69501.1 Isovaleryl-CoA dehydrogenase [Hyalangium minutum]
MNPQETFSAPVDFGRAPVAEPFMSAAGAIATANRSLSGMDRRQLSQAVERVRGLELASVLPELESRDDGPVLLFHMAELLGHAHLLSAWQGLSIIPARVAELPPSVEIAAIPDASAARWVAWLPVVDPASPPSVALGGPSGVLPLGPSGKEGPVPGLTGSRTNGLLGFPLGEVLTWTLQPGLTGGDVGMQPLAPSAWGTYVRAQLALLSGLLTGATRRLVEEAYAYAKTRQAAGKPIIQHQAVALRLADLALNHEALALYLTASVERCQPPGMKGGLEELSVGHISDLSFRIARDAVQTAAGHGYVEGLPFRRLFEQVRTLTVMIGAMKAASALSVSTS